MVLRASALVGVMSIFPPSLDLPRYACTGNMPACVYMLCVCLQREREKKGGGGEWQFDIEKAIEKSGKERGGEKKERY